MTNLEFHLTNGGGQGGKASCCISRLGGKVAYVGKLVDDEGQCGYRGYHETLGSKSTIASRFWLISG